MGGFRTVLAWAALAALGVAAAGEAAGASPALADGGSNNLRRALGLWEYDCETCGISCMSISSCRGENDYVGCSNVYCANTNDDAAVALFLSAYVGIWVGAFALCWVVPCFFMCCSISSFKSKEASLPPHMRTLDEGMKWAFVGATCCFGCVGWGIMHCVIQSRIDQQIMMVNAGLGGTGQAGMMQPQYVQPGAQMQMQQPQTQMQPVQAYVVAEPSVDGKTH